MLDERDIKEKTEVVKDLKKQIQIEVCMILMKELAKTWL